MLIWRCIESDIGNLTCYARVTEIFDVRGFSPVSSMLPTRAGGHRCVSITRQVLPGSYLYMRPRDTIRRHTFWPGGIKWHGTMSHVMTKGRWNGTIQCHTLWAFVIFTRTFVFEIWVNIVLVSSFLRHAPLVQWLRWCQPFMNAIRIGRCVERDLGFLGCHVDVTEILSSRCAGNQSCEISVSDKELAVRYGCSFLSAYLAVAYTCDPVTMMKGKMASFDVTRYDQGRVKWHNTILYVMTKGR